MSKIPLRDKNMIMKTTITVKRLSGNNNIEIIRQQQQLGNQMTTRIRKQDNNNNQIIRSQHKLGNPSTTTIRQKEDNSYIGNKTITTITK